MRFLSSLPHKRIAWALFYLLLAFVIGYLFIRYLLSAFLPFFLAFLTAAALRRPALRLARGNKKREKAIRIALVIVILLSVIFALSFTVIAIIRELGDFVASFAEEENALLRDLSRMLDRLSAFLAELPFFRDKNTTSMRETLLSILSEWMKNTAMNLATELPEWIGALVAAIPRIMLFFAVTIISAIYFCLDIEKLLQAFRTKLPEKARPFVKTVCGECSGALLQYLKAYSLLFLFTFSQLFIGFALLRERYAFLLALITALIDVLPILGTGTVLIPWALWRFLTGHLAGAVGLLVLYAVITLSRQLLEPKLLGAKMGLPPLFTLIALYGGLKLFGLWGMILMPPLLMIAKNSAMAFAKLSREENP